MARKIHSAVKRNEGGVQILRVRWWDRSINRIWVSVFVDAISYLEFKTDIEPENKVLEVKEI